MTLTHHALVSAPLIKGCFHQKKIQVLVSVPLTKDCLHHKPLFFGGHFFETSCPCKCTSHQRLSSPETIPLRWSPFKHYALVSAPLIKGCLHQKKTSGPVSVPLTQDCLHHKPLLFGGHFFETSCPCKCISHQRLPSPETNPLWWSLLWNLMPCKCISQQKQSFFHDQFLLNFTVVCHHLYSCMKCRICALFSWDCFTAHIPLMHQFCGVGVAYLPTFSSMLTYHNKHWLWRKQYWSCITVPSILIYNYYY